MFVGTGITWPRTLGAAVEQLRDEAYRQHVIAAFNERAKEMDVVLLRLTLFLHPQFRRAAITVSSSSNSSMDDPVALLQTKATELAAQLGYTRSRD